MSTFLWISEDWVVRFTNFKNWEKATVVRNIPIVVRKCCLSSVLTTKLQLWQSIGYLIYALDIVVYKIFTMCSRHGASTLSGVKPSFSKCSESGTRSGFDTSLELLIADKKLFFSNSWLSFWKFYIFKKIKNFNIWTSWNYRDFLRSIFYFSKKL